MLAVFGISLGAALGAKLAAPGREVIAVVGDGSYMFGNPLPYHFVARAERLPILTIVGYSINDTVVVYDRVRENLRKYKKMPIEQLLDLSMNQTLSRAIYFAVAAMGLNLLTGFNGQVSIGHGAFFGVGAFTTAILMNDHGWSFELTIPMAALVAAALGVGVGIPALRVKGLYLALVTLGLAVLFPRVGQKFVEGQGGVAIIRPKRSGFDSLLTFLENDQWHYVESLLIAAVIWLAIGAILSFFGYVR